MVDMDISELISGTIAIIVVIGLKFPFSRLQVHQFIHSYYSFSILLYQQFTRKEQHKIEVKEDKICEVIS